MRDTVNKRARLDELRHQLDEAWRNSRHFDTDRIAQINAELRALIKDEPPPPAFEPWGDPLVGTMMSKAKHTVLDAESLMTAVETAASLMGCKPDEILVGLAPGSATQDYIATVARARGYAAMALQDLFEVPASQISRACGSSEASCGVHLSVFRKRIADNQAPWFKQITLDAVKYEVMRGLSDGS